MRLLLNFSIIFIYILYTYINIDIYYDPWISLDVLKLPNSFGGMSRCFAIALSLHDSFNGPPGPLRILNLFLRFALHLAIGCRVREWSATSGFFPSVSDVSGFSLPCLSPKARRDDLQLTFCAPRVPVVMGCLFLSKGDSKLPLHSGHSGSQL